MAYEGFYRGVQPVGRLFRNNDIIPILGFGTGTGYFERPEAVAEGIIIAYKAGYRLIDTAQVNHNLIDITKHPYDYYISLFILQQYYRFLCIVGVWYRSRRWRRIESTH